SRRDDSASSSASGVVVHPVTKRASAMAGATSSVRFIKLQLSARRKRATQRGALLCARGCSVGANPRGAAERRPTRLARLQIGEKVLHRGNLRVLIVDHLLG